MLFDIIQQLKNYNFDERNSYFTKYDHVGGFRDAQFHRNPSPLQFQCLKLAIPIIGQKLCWNYKENL